MPAPLYGADDARRCSGNSVSEVLDKFRKNYDRIMSLPQETKEEKEFRHCIWLAEKEERERIYQTSIRPFRKATYRAGIAGSRTSCLYFQTSGREIILGFNG